MEQSFARWIALLAILPAAGASTIAIAHLPNVQINAAKVDSSGNIYVAGQTPTAAYITKLSPDGVTTFYATTIGGSATTVTLLDIDPAGAVYVAGATTAADFPVAAGAPDSTAFAAKLDAKGNIVYATLLGGSTKPQLRSIVVNSKKELVVSGQAMMGSPAFLALFTQKLSADGTQVVQGPQGIGGLATLDAHDNIYVAGVPPSGPNEPSATPGAFQAMPPVAFCGCPFFSFSCGGDQFVASVSADLSQIRFLTYVTAEYGATPSYITIDAQGNILIAGTTAAPAYPTTLGSYQPNYTAASGTVLTCGPPISVEYTSPSGYVTLVKPDGSGLIFSTFFSGSKSDSITFAALTNVGIYLAGQASSVDLPGFDGAVPSPCVPLGFVARMTPDGTAVSASRTPPGTPLAYDSTTGTLLLASGNDLLRFNPTAPTPIACMLDAADLSPATTVAPGELLAMFGRFLYFVTDPFGVPIVPTNSMFPVKSQGLRIVANQTPAPLLYLSTQQINFQAPYEIAGSPQSNFTVTYSSASGESFSDSRTLTVAASNPVAFLSQPSIFNQTFPLTLNADGSLNSQTNPAAAGSDVAIFIDGLGLTTPAPVTGAVTSGSPAPLNIPMSVTPSCNGTFCYPAPAVISAIPAAGSISGVTQVQLRAPDNPRPGAPFQVVFSLTAGPLPVRDLNLSFWAK